MGRLKVGMLVALAALILSIPATGSTEDAYSCYACPPELAGATFPEPRAFIETQGWWVQGQTNLTDPDISNDPATDFAFASIHVHLGIPFPLGEQFIIPPEGSPYAWDYLAQWHENVGGAVRQVRGGMTGGNGCTDTGIPNDPNYRSVPITLVNQRYAGTIPVSAAKVTCWRDEVGTREFRFTADTTSKFGKREYQSGAWNAQINAPAVPVAVTARGWYEGPGYTNVTMKTKAQAHSLADGSWYASGKVISYGLAQGATRAFAYIDPDIHHGTKGLVLMENKTGSSGTFVLPDLPPGDHVLLLGGWEKAAAGWNAGVLRLPFNVPEPEAVER